MISAISPVIRRLSIRSPVSDQSHEWSLYGVRCARQGDRWPGLTPAAAECHTPFMADLRSICVYCGSNQGAAPDYAAAAAGLGRAMAEAGIRLVYGGGSVGLVGIFA